MSLILRCYDQTRTNVVAADVVLAVLGSGRLGQHINAGLCAGICSGADIAGAGSHGTDIDDGAAVLILLHVRKNTLGGVEGTTHIALENVVPHLDGKLVYTAVL